MREGAWAELAALPIAGLTALHALGHDGLLASKRVLVTGTTGGVGLFAVRLAQISGACVVAAIRGPEHEAVVEGYRDDRVVVGDLAAGGAARSAPTLWPLPRATVHRPRLPPRPKAPRRRGPRGPMPDAAPLGAIRAVLAASPFHGDGRPGHPSRGRDGTRPRSGRGCA